MSGIVKTNMVRRILPFMLLALFLAIVPVAIPAYWTDLLTFVLIYYIYAISFDLLLGYLGLISFGHQIFWVQAPIWWAS